MFAGVGLQVLGVGVGAPSSPSSGCKGWGFQADMGQGERTGRDDVSADSSDCVRWAWLSRGLVSGCCEQSNLIRCRCQNASQPRPHREIYRHVRYRQKHFYFPFSSLRHCVWSHCCDSLRERDENTTGINRLSGHKNLFPHYTLT